VPNKKKNPGATWVKYPKSSGPSPPATSLRCRGPQRDRERAAYVSLGFCKGSALSFSQGGSHWLHRAGGNGCIHRLSSEQLKRCGTWRARHGCGPMTGGAVIAKVGGWREDFGSCAASAQAAANASRQSLMLAERYGNITARQCAKCWLRRYCLRPKGLGKTERTGNALRIALFWPLLTTMNWKSRVKAIGAGVILVAAGYLRIRGGIQVVTHWTGQPMFSFGLIAAGLVLIASAAIPERLISKLTNIKKL
jgi:hypothetical protein